MGGSRNKGLPPMTKLTDTQLVILTAACQRDGRRLLPLPERLKGGAATKVVDSLLAKGLAAETEAGRDDAVWREDGDDRFTLVATDAAFAALGIEDESPAAQPQEPAAQPEAEPLAEAGSPAADVAPHGGDEAAAAPEPAEAAEAGPAAPDAPREGASGSEPPEPAERPRKTRADSKQAQLIEMLKRPDGATVAEIADAFGWQHHTVRGAIAGALKKKLGLEVASDKVEGRGRVYRIASA